MEWTKVFATLFSVAILVGCSKEQGPAFEVPSTEEEYLELYFNKTESGLDRPYFFRNILCSYIDFATRSIDIAMFTAEEMQISEALNRARDRGVRIRYITSGDKQANTALPVLHQDIPIHYGDPGFSMHHKFMIIDQRVVINSSANNAQWDLTQQANNMVIAQSKDLAVAFVHEFEQMWGGPEDLPAADKAKFGWEKEKSPRNHFEIAGVPVEMYFNPQDSANRRLIDAFEAAEQEVAFAQMLFFGGDLGAALLGAMEQDVKLFGVLKEYYTRYDLSEYWTIMPAGAEVRIDTLPRGIHHKYAVIDAGDPGAMVLTGSYNWHADSIAIDDNLMVIHDSAVAERFRANVQMEYDRAILQPDWQERLVKVREKLRKLGRI